VPTITLCSRDASEYRLLISSSYHFSMPFEYICKFSTTPEILWSDMFPRK